VHSTSSLEGSVPRIQLLCVVQFGNNSSLVRQIIRNRPGWGFGPGDPCNNFGKVTQEKQVKVPLASDLPEVQFLWTKYHHTSWIDAMASAQPGVCVTLNEQQKLQLKQKQMKSKNIDEVPQLLHPRVHNHFKGEDALCTKRGLCENFVKFYMGHHRDPFGAIPLTFVIRKGSDDDQFAIWQHVFEAVAKEYNQSIWLVKPAEWANGGSGIRIFDNLQEIIDRLDSKEKTWVVQKYIEQPFLVHKRKFDIRAYCLVTQDAKGGAFRAYFYNDAYLRTTSAAYTTKNFDRMVHLNNDAVQKKGEDYGKFENANKLSLSEFQCYLTEHHSASGFSVQGQLVPQLKHLMADAICATHRKLNPVSVDHCFQVLGFDFMVDASFRAWLIEVNSNPCLELCNAYLARLIPKMLDEAFQLTIDRIFPFAAANRGARAAATATGWEQVFCSSDPDSDRVRCSWVSELPQQQEGDGIDQCTEKLGRDILVPRCAPRKSAKHKSA